MDIIQISQLATVLRENGDKVLNSKSKFSLSTNLLSNLNHYFAQVIDRDAASSSFQVVNNSNLRTEFYRDLQFLHDFVQRTLSLKLTPSIIQGAEIETVDISKFKNIQLLQLHKVSPSIVRGIQLLKRQIHFLVCNRSVKSLGEILEKCGADDSLGYTWGNLKEASFSHNNLQQLDGSLEYVPWLNSLDLSHNQISNASAVNCLPNLKSLNLSYNRLETVPAFTGLICSRLQVLYLNNNFIEDIKELTSLINLCELDLSNNCLLDHESMGSLTYLAALQWLNMVGNPLSFHPQHRTRLARYLHKNTGTVRFTLDHVLLNPAEKKLAGSLHLIQAVLHRSHHSSVCSETSEATVVGTSRHRRVRNVVISDSEDETEDKESSMCSYADFSGNLDHLETKQKIEQLRKEYGETWLHSLGGGSFVQEVLGLEKTWLTSSSSPYQSDFLIHAQDVDFGQKEKASEVVSEQSTANTFTTANDESTLSDNNSIYGGERAPTPEAPLSDDENLGEGEENLYLANVKDDSEPVFIVLTDTHLRERDCMNGKERMHWHLDGLQSCELLGDDCTEIRLTFDTLRRDRRQRLYVLDVNEATRLSCVLNNILTNRPPEISKLVVYKCMKCSTQFSNEKQRGLEAPVLECPICQSKVVIEDDEA